MTMTLEALETVRPYEDAIIAAVARGDLTCSALVNQHESIASYCIFNRSYPPKIKEIRPFPNDDRAFPLLRWMAKEPLLSLASQRPILDGYIEGITRAGPHKGNPCKLSVKTILECKPGIPDNLVREHIDLHFGSLCIGEFLTIKDWFHLHRSELINAWRANIALDLYGREDTRKVARVFERILRDFPLESACGRYAPCYQAGLATHGQFSHDE